MKVGRLVLATLFAAAIAATPFAAQQAVGQGKAPVVKYKIVDEDSIPESLTGKPGDPEKGKKWAIAGRLGHCIACHVMPVDQPYMGEVGPSLVGVASRYEAGQLRMLIVDPKIINEDTMMPAFYKADGFHRVRKAFVGTTMLSAQQVEDIVAYLMTLKEEEKD
ncbi:MAG: sulfur oxidation c-type cytochrome SoxX [Rhodospirillaceae bacterium]|nr:sulfur oxidation c-type cytochrome SoxX [Rhodospirillaceae bacterium]MYJ72407.1 sulfur oxidation c-type cytochrome SoxX [Rhodospirillaceae bacterium]